MAFVHFFRRDQRCAYVKWLLKDILPTHIQGEDAKYVVNLDWNAGANKGVNKSHLDANNLSYINNIDELPKGKGLLVFAYDGDPEQVADAKARGVDVVEKSCPWVVKLRREILSVRQTHQCVLMIEEGHVLHRNYQRIFPPETVFINRTNYTQRLPRLDPGRPVHFLVYATFRTEDAQRAVDWLKSHGYDDPDSIYSFAGICSMVTARDNVFAQLRDTIPRERLDEVWVITGGVENTSVESICAEVAELGARTRMIHVVEDIPLTLEEDRRVGVLTAPTPYDKEDWLLATIRERFGVASEALS